MRTTSHVTSVNKSALRRLFYAPIALFILSVVFTGCSHPTPDSSPQKMEAPHPDQSASSPGADKENGASGIVITTPKEYDSLNAEEKRLAGLLQASVKALDALKDNPELEDYEATIYFERDPISKYTGIIVAAPDSGKKHRAR